MYKIGEFSNLSKTTIKTLRYYEKEGLLIPSYVDEISGYRFYETDQLLVLSKIISLRQIGMSIDNIKNVIDEKISLSELLKSRKKEIENELSNTKNQLSRINCLLEEKNMKYEAIVKELPDYVVYYKEGIIEDFSKMTEFILSSAEECMKTNPNIKCITPDYCYVSYLDREYKNKNIRIRYSQAVTSSGIENDTIKFEKLKPVTAVCTYHKGSFNSISEAYSFLMKWIEDNGYEIIEAIRERYIDGIWNKETEDEWLTEIQVPISKK